MKAATIAVGTELLGAGRSDTNGIWISERLERAGVDVASRLVVADDAALLSEAVRALTGSVAFVVVTGGLGPTEDDRTREALALASGAPLERDEAMVERLRARFEAYGRPFAPEQERQALRPAGSRFLENPVGSAPGIRLRAGAAVVYSLPGVPAEMRAMYLASVEPEIASRSSASLLRRTLRIAGRTESSVDAQVRDLYAEPGIEATILASAGTIEIVLRARGRDAEEARDRLSRVEGEMRARLGEDLYGADEATLPGAVGEELLRTGRTVATAESCTGGLLGAALTSVPGSSAWYRGGLVVYANDLKETFAGVPASTIGAHGAVSDPVARALARGARERAGADYGLGVTGVAGPAGGTPEKPVGLVHLAVADASGERGLEIRWPGDRDLIRRRAVAIALDLLRRRLRQG